MINHNEEGKKKKTRGNLVSCNQIRKFIYVFILPKRLEMI